MPPTMGGPTEAGQGGPIVKALGEVPSRCRPEPTPRGKEAALGDEAVRSPRTPGLQGHRCSSEARTPSYRIGVALLAN